MKIPLLVILGPTAVGKTAAAIDVAKRLKGEIISADSRQVYRYMDIGTAKPSEEERKGVPHHLLDLVYPDENFSVAEFQRLARRVIREIHSRGLLPVMAGGTGLYINAVVDNYNFASMATNWEFRQALWKEAEKKGGGFLHHRLQRVDPVTAERLHPNDLRRIIRALEVFQFTGRPLSQWEKDQGEDNPFLSCLVGLSMERNSLYQVINRRVDRMIAAGLIQEVEGLLDMGYSPKLNSMQGLGYKELIPYVTGKISLSQAEEDLKRNTRRFAKRQLTWFRRDQRINWIPVDPFKGGCLVEEISKLAAGKLGRAENRLYHRE